MPDDDERSTGGHTPPQSPHGTSSQGHAPSDNDMHDEQLNALRFLEGSDMSFMLGSPETMTVAEQTLLRNL